MWERLFFGTALVILVGQATVAAGSLQWERLFYGRALVTDRTPHSPFTSRPVVTPVLRNGVADETRYAKALETHAE